MKDFLKKQLKAKEERRTALKEKGKKSESVEEIRAITDQIEELDKEIAEFRSQLEALPTDDQQGNPGERGEGTEPGEVRSTPQGQFRPMGSYGMGTMQQGQEQREGEADAYGTVEYRQAFMKFAKTGEITPELRADATTTTGDISAVIPSTILNEVVKRLKVYGQVYKRVRKLNIKGGVTVPVVSLKPKATWIGETTPSKKQKVEANTKVSFAYYGLECKVSVSLLADTVSLDNFESTITELIVEAMIQAIDMAVINGDGEGKALGLAKDPRVPAGNIITLSPEEVTSWAAWKRKVFAKMPLAYKAGATFLMASGTFEGYIDGMVDAQGQPVGRVNYGITDGPQERFGGKEVIQVEDDVIAPYDDAEDDDVVGVYCNLQNYAFNSNMQMTMFRYFDHDTNEWVDKAILIADGKLLDPNGVVVVKKGAQTTT